MFSLDFLRDYLKKQTENTRTRQVICFLVVASLITFLVFTNFAGTEMALKPGQISPRNIRAPHTAVITDEDRTSELQKQAASKVRKVYQEDREALGEAQKQVNYFFGQIATIKSNPSPTREENLERISYCLDDFMRDKRLATYDASGIAGYLVDASDRDIESMRAITLQMVKSLMNTPITEEALPAIQEEVGNRTKALSFAPTAQRTVELVVIKALRPNLIFNEEATQRAIDEAVSKIMPVQRTIQQGQMIVREGDPVTKQHIEILKQLGVQRSRSFGVTLAGTALFVFIFLGLFLMYLYFYHPQIYKDGHLTTLLGLIFILVLALAKALTVIKVGERPEINALVGYLIPVSAGSMLVATLLNQNIAYFFTFVMAIFVGLLTQQGTQISYVVAAFVGGVIGVFRVARLNHSGDLARSGLYIALGNIITILALSLIFSNITVNLAIIGALFGALNGIVSAILTIGLLPYLETVFSITSSVKLLELSNPNQDLLRSLLVEAPGTYHHSIMVGNLAESAAESIGAQALTVRVGAYYHDIGKLKRPYFFVENQLGAENPHEKIAPSLSALIITSHIKDGVELAREKRLPRTIIDFIEQHHGTSLVKYFYSRALEEDQEGIVNEETFRYEGPKPQSKEVALVMLADSIEAAVRSMRDPSPGRIDGMVRRIIKDKLYDGQLDECDLTFRDLDIIGESFSKVLNGVYHNRIEYPETLAQEFEKRREKLEDIGSQPTDRT